MVVRLLGIHQDGVVASREKVAPPLGRAARIVDLEEPAHRLLLQPLADVALLGPGLGCQLRRRWIPR
jgi:hypothetical protein